MRLKKFVCIRCGAPKVNSYSTPYIVCDFCGTLTDIDFAIGLNVWNNSQEHTSEYVNKKIKLESLSANYLKNNDRKNYWKTQYKFWDYYYQHFPQYLPPTANTKEKYDLFIQAAADMMTDFSFNPKQSDHSSNYNKNYSNLQYYQKDGKSYVTWKSFKKMIVAYIDLCKDSFRLCYDNPKYAIMKDIVPEDIHLKLRISQTAQIWLPYLEEEHAKEFLNMYNLVNEFTDVPRPAGTEGNCSNCHQALFIPAGAVKLLCPHCNHEEIITQTINCVSCGIENDLPDDWVRTIACKSCGTQLEVIKPLFG